MNTDKIREAFQEYFKRQGIKLPDPVPAKGTIHQADWSITYVLTEDEQHHPCLEFLAVVQGSSSIHSRILETGEMIALDTFQELYSFDPEVPGDKEAAKQRMIEHNKRVSAELERKGLF